MAKRETITEKRIKTLVVRTSALANRATFSEADIITLKGKVDTLEDRSRGMASALNLIDIRTRDDEQSKSIDALTARVADLSRQCQALAGIMESASHRISKLERPRPWWRRLATLWPFSTER